MKNPEPSIQALKLLAAVAAEGGLTTAARRLGLSQSGASHALHSLETSLGGTLFVHDPKGLKLSDAGARVLRHVHSILDALEAVRAEMSGLRQMQKGTLRIAAVPTLAATVVPRLMARYHTLYPGIDVFLLEGTDDEVRDWVLAGTAQVGFAALPVPGLHGTELMQDEWLALVPANEFRGRRTISLAGLSRRPFLMSGGGCEPHIRRLFEDAAIECPSHQTVKQLGTIFTMVAGRLGVSVVPSIAVQTAPRGTRILPLAPRRFRRIGRTQYVLRPGISSQSGGCSRAVFCVSY